MSTKSPRSSSLIRRIAMAQLAVLLALASIQISLVFWLFFRVSEESEQRLMLTSAADLAELVQPYVASNPDYSSLQKLAATITTANKRIDLYLLDSEGTILGSFGRFGSAQVIKQVPLEPIHKLIAEGLATDLPLHALDPAVRKREVIFSAAPITVAGKPGYLFLTLNNTLTNNVYIMSVENLSVISSLAGFFGSVIVAGLLGVSLLRYLNRRLQSLLSVVTLISENDFKARVPPSSPDEIGYLGERINTMADRLEENIGQLERRDSLRRELIADVSHDLRGPVASIKGYLELLTMMKAEKLAERLPSILPSLTISTAALERLLSQLFELAKLEAKELEPSELAFEFDSLVGDIVLACRAIAEAKGVTITLIAQNENLFVKGDTRLLERALRNLIENAIYYSPAGGTVSISLTPLPDAIEVAIKDQGIGIAQEDLARIFGRFEQGKNSSQSSRASSGLGLAIAQKIVELHHAAIKVSSVVGEGSTFSFCLPR